MTLLAVCSAKGSPGVTVTALALTLTAQRPVVLAECDPAGGDIAAGYLAGIPLGDRGLSRLTSSLHRDRLADDLWGMGGEPQLVDLSPISPSGHGQLLLPGLCDPAQAARWADTRRAGGTSGWGQLADLFTTGELARRYDVVADCGRLSAAAPPSDVLTAADAVLLVVRPELPPLRTATVALAGLRAAGVSPVGLVLVGDRPYGAREVGEQLNAEVVATLPWDSRTAVVLSQGGLHHRGALLSAITRAQTAIWSFAQRDASECDAVDGRYAAGRRGVAERRAAAWRAPTRPPRQRDLPATSNPPDSAASTPWTMPRDAEAETAGVPEGVGGGKPHNESSTRQIVVHNGVIMPASALRRLRETTGASDEVPRHGD